LVTMSSVEDLELNLSFFEFRWPVIGQENSGAECNGWTSITSPFFAILEEATGRKWSPEDDSKPLGKAGFFSTYVNEEGSHVVLRYYTKTHLATVDVQELKSSSVFTSSVIDKMLDLLKKRFSIIPLRHYLSLPRVSNVPQLYCTSDERVMVYDFDRTLCEIQSEYQHIKILHSKEFGNTLILDDFVNLAEKDLVYTHQLMWKGVISYKDKDVLVLGGGDGGVLNEVLKENPKFVTMLEIDETVVNMCKKYLRGACGDSLDSMTGPRHQIIIDDCFTQLDKFAKAGRQFDVVFSDLTDVPLVREREKERGEFWSLMRRALEMGLRVVKPKGQFLTHLVGLSAMDVISEYEKMLKEWRNPTLKFERAEAMVPSFLEVWTFYRIWVE